MPRAIETSAPKRTVKGKKRGPKPGPKGPHRPEGLRPLEATPRLIWRAQVNPEWIKVARISLGLTMREIGKAAGVPESTWSNYETGETEPPARVNEFLLASLRETGLGEKVLEVEAQQAERIAVASDRSSARAILQRMKQEREANAARLRARLGER